MRNLFMILRLLKFNVSHILLHLWMIGIESSIAVRSTGISVGRYSDIVCKSIYTTIMHSRLGMLFESSRRVVGGNGGNVDRISNAANMTHRCESYELAEIQITFA